MIVYAFEPKSPPSSGGDLNGRIAGDMKGKMWINPEEAEVVRMEFASAASLNWLGPSWQRETLRGLHRAAKDSRRYLGTKPSGVCGPGKATFFGVPNPSGRRVQRVSQNDHRRLPADPCAQVYSLGRRLHECPAVSEPQEIQPRWIEYLIAEIPADRQLREIAHCPDDHDLAVRRLNDNSGESSRARRNAVDDGSVGAESGIEHAA